jgi:hypothetical protein
MVERKPAILASKMEQFFTEELLEKLVQQQEK